MPGRLRSRAVAPRLSRPAACFEHLIFANENRCNHQHEFLSNPAYRKFSGDCAWNPYQAVTPEDMQAICQRLVAAAKGGDWLAAQTLLKWLLGKPPEPVDPWQVLVQAVAKAA